MGTHADCRLYQQAGGQSAGSGNRHRHFAAALQAVLAGNGDRPVAGHAEASPRAGRAGEARACRRRHRNGRRRHEFSRQQLRCRGGHVRADGGARSEAGDARAAAGVQTGRRGDRGQSLQHD